MMKPIVYVVAVSALLVGCGRKPAVNSTVKLKSLAAADLTVADIHAHLASLESTVGARVLILQDDIQSQNDAKPTQAQINELKGLTKQVNQFYSEVLTAQGNEIDNAQKTRGANLKNGKLKALSLTGLRALELKAQIARLLGQNDGPTMPMPTKPAI